jgi:hypothetical protein
VDIFGHNCAAKGLEFISLCQRIKTGLKQLAIIISIKEGLVSRMRPYEESLNVKTFNKVGIQIKQHDHQLGTVMAYIHFFTSQKARVVCGIGDIPMKADAEP